MYIGGLIRYSFYDLSLIMTCITRLADGRLSIVLCVEKGILHMLMAYSANIPEKNGKKISFLGFNF